MDSAFEKESLAYFRVLSRQYAYRSGLASRSTTRDNLTIAQRLSRDVADWGNRKFFETNSVKDNEALAERVLQDAEVRERLVAEVRCSGGADDPEALVKATSKVLEQSIASGRLDIPLDSRLFAMVALKASKFSTDTDSPFSTPDESATEMSEYERCLNLGVEFHSRSEYESAVEQYSKALIHQPDSALVFYNRALSYLELGRFDEALADIDNAVKYGGREPDFFYVKGTIESNLGQTTRAIGSLDIAISLRSDDTDSYYARGFLQEELGNYSEALADYDAALALDPSNQLASTRRSDLLRLSGQ